MVPFRDLPIRRKLTVANWLTTGVALLLASVAFMAYELVTFRQQMIESLGTQAGVLAYNSVSAILFNDSASANETLRRLRSEPHITAATIFGKDGKQFAVYKRPDVSEIAAPPPTTREGRVNYSFWRDRLVVSVPILSEGEPIGRIQMSSDLEDMYARVRRYLGIVALVFGASLLAALPVLSRLQRAISGPILHLVQQARSVSERKDYSVRAVASGKDELGLLVQTFNEMLTQIQQRDAELERARDEAEAANRAKDQFLAVVSHELRTPLTPILLWTHMLQSGLDQSTAKRAIDTIERSVKSQAQIIDDLLDVSRIITGKLRLDVRPVDLGPVIAAAIDSVRPAADAKGIRLQSVIDPHSATVSGDPERLQQVMWNLLSNSIKFTPKGGRVQVRVQRINSHIEISVSDSGKGITVDLMPHVFERFRQGDSTSTRSYGGLGLGLAIVRHLVELHGGRVRADSPGEGQGATFTVELPLAILHTAPSPSRVHPTADDGAPLNAAPHLDGLRVLIVDDEPDTLSVLATVLSRSGADVRTSQSAAEALREFDDWRPELLVSDIGMPEEDGYELIRKVRARAPECGGRIPALALTAFARLEDRVRVLSAGFQMHVPKPIEPIELVTVVANLRGRIA